MVLPAISMLKIEKGTEISKLITLVVPIVSVLISILVVALVVWPKFNEVLRLRSANKDLEILAGKLEEKADKLSSLDGDKLVIQLGAAEQILPSDKEPFVLVRQTEGAAAVSGVLLNRIEVVPGAIGQVSAQKETPPAAGASAQPPTGGDTGAEASKIQLRISLTGDYKSLLSFLDNILSLPRVATIRDLVVFSGQSGQLTSAFMIEAYWQSIPTELASIETPIEDLTQSESARLEQVTLAGLASPAAVPPVPLGRSDLFSPF